MRSSFRKCRSDGETGDQFGSGFVIASGGFVGSRGFQRRERRHPCADLLRGATALVGDERARPLIQFAQPAAVDDLQESVVPRRVERLQATVSGGETSGRVDDGRLPGPALWL